MSAVPVPDPLVEDRRERIILTGDLPSPANPPRGCRFHTRCPWKQETRCDTERPELRVPEIPGVGAHHRVACHWTEQIESGEIQPHEVAPSMTDLSDLDRGTESLMGPASVSEAL
jgi:peptide/nickel transport system ATP-binding protein